MSESLLWNSGIDILQGLQAHDDDIIGYIDSSLVTTEDLQQSSQLSIVETVSPNALMANLGLGNSHSHVSEIQSDTNNWMFFGRQTLPHLSGAGVHGRIMSGHAPDHLPHSYPGYPETHIQQTPVYPPSDLPSHISEPVEQASNTNLSPRAEIHCLFNPTQVVTVQVGGPVVPESVIGGSSPPIVIYDDTDPSTSQDVVGSYREDPPTSARQAQASSNNRVKRKCPFCEKSFDPKPSNWKRHIDTHTSAKRFMCTQCLTRKTTRDQVVIHYITHHLGKSLKGRRPYPDEREQGEQYVFTIS